MNQLIETSDFDVGPWRVRPSRSEVEAGGTSVRLEPRVMGVLVALARRPGETVARERLIAEVWDGRVVTDDAVQRCIAALRKILRSRPGADIETIPKLGYVLRVSGDPRTAGDPYAAGDLGVGHKAFRPWPAAVLGLVLVLGAALWWMSTDIPASSQSAAVEPRSTPLTSLRGREVQPALAPSGGQVAFVWFGEDGGNADIYVKTVSGEGMLRLTEDPARDLHPVWSADGGEIAFVRVADTGCTVLRVAAIGGAPRHVAHCGAGQVRSLDWSPDGTQFAITMAGDDLAAGRLHLIDAASGEARPLSAVEALDASIEDARFSPDGTLLAFTVGRALGVEDVHVYRFADRTLRRLTFDQLKVHSLDWTADGRAIVFSSNRSGPFRLWQAALDNAPPVLVAGAGDAADDPSVAAGGRVAYEVWREDADIVRFDLGDPGVEPVRVAGSTRFEWDARVSPDGRRLAYVSDQSGAAEVWVAARDGTAARRLTSFAGPYTHSPRWSPDSSQLAFVSPVSGRMDLFVLLLDEGRPRRIGASDVDYFAPTWTRDGAAVVAGGRRITAAGRTEGQAIWRVPLNGDAAERISPPGARTPQLSADGALLYYTKVGEPGVWRRRVDDAGGGEERLIAELTPVDWNNWLVTPTAIFYLRRTPAPAPDLMRFDLARRETRLVRPLPGLHYKSGLWISPDERELFATVVLTAESDLHTIDPAAASLP